MWWGKFHRTAPVVVVGNATTLELIAAPASALAHPVAAVVATALPVPAPPPPESITPANVLPPLAVAEAIFPMPAPPVTAVSEPISVATPAVPLTVTAVNNPTATTTTGDNSSPMPGKDFTSATGSPTATAKPDYLKNPEPEYPLAARRRGQQGVVILNVTVSPLGHAKEVSIKESSGYELLDQAALRAVKTWEFEPARIGSIGVESRIEVPVRFKLAN